MNSELLNLLRSDLSRSRVLPAKEAEDISLRLGVEEPVEGLNLDRLKELEEWEVEVLISPLFTPGPEQRTAYEAVLVAEGADPNELNVIIDQLLGENISCPVVFGEITAQLVIPEVVLRRYVRLLHLDGQVGSKLVKLLKELAPGCDYRRALSLARQPVWRKLKDRELLVVCLETIGQRNSFTVNKLDFLTEFVRTNRPQSMDELISNLNSLVESYERDQQRPIFNQLLREFQENAIRPRFCGTQIKAYRISMAQALLKDFQPAQ